MVKFSICYETHGGLLQIMKNKTLGMKDKKLRWKVKKYLRPILRALKWVILYTYKNNFESGKAVGEEWSSSYQEVCGASFTWWCVYLFQQSDGEADVVSHDLPYTSIWSDNFDTNNMYCEITKHIIFVTDEYWTTYQD